MLLFSGYTCDWNSVGFELGVHLHTWVAHMWKLVQVLLLWFLVHVCNDSLLVCWEGKQLAFVCCTQIGKFCGALINFLCQNWQNRVVNVLHFACSDSDKSWFETCFKDIFFLSWVLKRSIYFRDSGLRNRVEQVLEVLMLKSLDGLKQFLGTTVEVAFKVSAWVDHKVN